MPLLDILDKQKDFDVLVNSTNCTGASDRVACLRAVPYAQLMAAINLYPGLLSFDPMVDEKLIQSNPLTLVQSGKYAKVLHTEFLYPKTSYLYRFHS